MNRYQKFVSKGALNLLRKNGEDRSYREAKMEWKDAMESIDLYKVIMQEKGIAKRNKAVRL